MTARVAKVFAAAFLFLASGLAGADQPLVVSPKAPLSVKGDVDARKEESRHVVLNGGREARVSLIAGKHGVVVDVYDAQNISPNEGVAEADWFPVTAGQYTITVSNITALGSGATGRNVAYEVRIEVR